jgi:transcriptional regulator with XRE-family HTH domain
MDEKALGKRLQLARRRAGLTQQELCQKAGLSYSTLAKIERGAIRSPSVFTVAAISQATNIPLESLLNIQPAGLNSPTLTNPKKRSKSGVTFVYFDVNGVLVRFFHKAFTEIARISNKPTKILIGASIILIISRQCPELMKLSSGHQSILRLAL